MSIQETERPALDATTVRRLSEGFNACFETFEARADVFAEDAFFDLLPPLWRFQVQGADAFTAQLRHIAGKASSRARILRVVPTADGFVLEQQETMTDPDTAATEVARRLWLCLVRDGRIAEVTGYCNGGWDAALRARHAAEAPMLRPDEVTS